MNPTRRTPTITTDQLTLTTILAERVMHWRVGPDRFLTGNRGWIRRGRFQPLARIEDAFQVVYAAGAGLVLTVAKDGLVTAEVKVANREGRASSTSAATSITVAVGRALGLDECATLPIAGQKGTVRRR